VLNPVAGQSEKNETSVINQPNWIVSSFEKFEARYFCSFVKIFQKSNKIPVCAKVLKHLGLCGHSFL